MAIVNPMDILMAQDMSQYEIDFDSMMIPSMYNYLSPYDIEELHKIATSAKLSAKVQEKYRLIEAIMKPKGFKRFAAGTNRVVYSYLEDDRFLVKIAMDRVGMQDNPAEFRNQFLLKPYVAKTFQVSPCGTVAFVERVLPIKNKEEFKEIAGDVFEILVNKILGEYVMEDIGAKYFMNWGVRKFGNPVLLDYPYLYKLDGARLFCNKVDEHGEYCNGEIDYDIGFNHLVCTKCGKEYLASDIGVKEKISIKKGVSSMKITVMRGNKVISRNYGKNDTFEKPEAFEPEVVEDTRPMKVTVIRHNQEEDKPNPTFTQENNSTNVVRTPKIEPMKVTIVRHDSNETETLPTSIQEEENPLTIYPTIESMKVTIVKHDNQEEDKNEEKIEQPKKIETDPKEILRNNLKKLFDDDDNLFNPIKLINEIRSLYHLDDIDELKEENSDDNEESSETDVEDENTNTEETSEEVEEASNEENDTESDNDESDYEDEEDSDYDSEEDDSEETNNEKEGENDMASTKEFNSREDIDMRDNLSDYDDEEYEKYERITPRRIKAGGSKKNNNKRNRDEEDD